MWERWEGPGLGLLGWLGVWDGGRQPGGGERGRRWPLHPCESEPLQLALRAALPASRWPHPSLWCAACAAGREQAALTENCGWEPRVGPQPPRGLALRRAGEKAGEGRRLFVH